MSNDETKQVAELIVERNHLQFSERTLREQLDRLRLELAEQYPVAMAARAACEEGRDPEVALAEIRATIRDIANSTAAAKLEYLPLRFREVTRG